MPRKSKRENKNIYFRSREEANLTRAQAAEQMDISDSVLEKLETDKQRMDPYYVEKMAHAYHNASLCNYYCSNECEIGKKYIPEADIGELSGIVLNMLANLNAMEKNKEDLINITADGKITPEEFDDFSRIYKTVNKISVTVEAMKIWVRDSLSEEQIRELEK